ncbi:hypothetical protein GCM10027578_10080 [Spirosoma luteolum]
MTDSVAVSRDTTYWQRSFTGSLNLNQASFSNWAGGGVNSVAIGGIVDMRALYEKARWSWDNTANLQLGAVNQVGTFRKSADQLLINSVAGYALAKHIDLFGSATFSSFLAPGYEYNRQAAGQSPLKVSGFLSPGQLTFAWGIAYKPGDWLSIRLSPFAPRFTFLADQSVRYRIGADNIVTRDPQATTYGVVAGQSVRTEWAALQLQIALARKLGENVSVSAKYQLYANYATLDAIDHRFDFLLTARISRFISTNVGLTALFDKDFSNAWQVQQVLGIGLGYSVSTFRDKKK